MYFKINRKQYEQINTLIKNEEEIYLKLDNLTNTENISRITYYDLTVLRDLFEKTDDDEVLWNIHSLNEYELEQE